jgi:UV DNA damage endonuclease
MERYVRSFERLPAHIQRRLVLENDDVSFSVADCLWIHERTGQRIVFDNLHHAAINPEGMPERDALDACLRTWPADQTPKIHFATPATQFLEAQVKVGKRTKTVQKPPSKWTSHADFVDPFEFERFLERGAVRPFDVMLEAKAKDLAVIALQSFLERRRTALHDREAGQVTPQTPSTEAATQTRWE